MKAGCIPLWQVLDVLADLLRAQLLIGDDPVGCVDGSQDAVVAEEQDSVGGLGDVVDDIGDILSVLWWVRLIVVCWLEENLLTLDVVGTAGARAKRTLRTARIWAFILLTRFEC